LGGAARVPLVRLAGFGMGVGQGCGAVHSYTEVNHAIHFWHWFSD
jgi:hypothetical protein